MEEQQLSAGGAYLMLLPGSGVESSGIAPAASAWQLSIDVGAVADDGDSGGDTTAGAAGTGRGAPAVTPLRCLDASHPAGCIRCAGPPDEGLDDTYELKGTDGKKNGEKRCGLPDTAR